ncbi:MAG: hypothetical protein NTZ78_08660 [Candidatus Aureabacteria bacterium]|nr:hypothetical protein [Candidatus Auribacterota bacterium]
MKKLALISSWQCLILLLVALCSASIEANPVGVFVRDSNDQRRDYCIQGEKLTYGFEVAYSNPDKTKVAQLSGVGGIQVATNENGLKKWNTILMAKINLSIPPTGTTTIRAPGISINLAEPLLGKFNNGVLEARVGVMLDAKIKGIKKTYNVIDVSAFTLYKEIARLPLPTTTNINGNVQIPLGSPMNPSEITVRAFAGNALVNSSGYFSGLRVFNEGKGQIAFVENGSGKAIAVAYISPQAVSNGNITIGYDEMALGLITLNPYISILTDSRRREVLDKAMLHSDYNSLKSDIENALLHAPSLALDVETYPYIFRKAVKIGIETIASYSNGGSSLREAYQVLMGQSVRGDVGNEDDPHIHNAEWSNITLVNPKQSFYGVQANARSNLIHGRGGLIEGPAWPWAIHFTEPTTKEWALGDGAFHIAFYKGFNTDRSEWLDIHHGAGKATYANFAKSVLIALDAVGFPIPILDDNIIESLLLLDNGVPQIDLGELAAFLFEKGWQYFLFDALPKVIDEHWEEIQYWFWQDTADFVKDSDNVSKFLRHLDELKGIVKGLSDMVAIAGDLLTLPELVNEWIPFFWDLAFAPGMIEYDLHREGGILVDDSSWKIPPTAAYMISKYNPSVGEQVTFDASGCSDDRDGSASLQVRWDYNGDKVWDTAWTTNKTAQWTYTQRGNFRPVLQVKDLQGLLSKCIHSVTVGSADSLKIVLTWGANPRDLDSHLYTPSISGHTYHIYYSNRGSLSSAPYAWLDIDDTSSYGPETTWIERFSPGTYTFKVYLYGGSGSLSSSSAHVEVISSDGVVARVDVPSSGSGRWWNVLRIDGSTRQVIVINTISNSVQTEGDKEVLLSDDPMPPKLERN